MAFRLKEKRAGRQSEQRWPEPCVTESAKGNNGMAAQKVTVVRRKNRPPPEGEERGAAGRSADGRWRMLYRAMFRVMPPKMKSSSSPLALAPLMISEAASLRAKE